MSARPIFSIFVTTICRKEAGGGDDDFVVIIKRITMNREILSTGFKERQRRFGRKSLSVALCRVLLLMAVIFGGSLKISAAQNHPFDSIARVVDEICFSQNTKAAALVDTLYEIASKSPDSSKLLIQCLYREAEWCYGQERTSPDLTDRIKTRLNDATEPLSIRDEALLRHSLGMHLFVTGNYSEAFTSSLQATSQFEILKDSSMAVKSNRLLGVICGRINLLELSNGYLERALSWRASDNSEVYRIQHDQYKQLIYKGEYVAAIDSLKRLIALCENAGEEALLPGIYINLGTAYYMCDMFDEAYEAWNKTEQLLMIIDNPASSALLYNNLGVMHGSRNRDHRTAISYFYKTKDIWESYGNIERLEAPYSGLAISYERLNEYDSALFYWRKNREVSQAVIANAKAIEVYKEYIVAFLESMESQLTIAEQEIEIKNRQALAMIIVFISLILLALLSLLLMQQQKRRRVSENRELSSRLEHEKTMQRLEKQQQEEIIDAKTREITSYSLLLSNKNNILQQILKVNEQGRNNRWDVHEITRKTDDIIRQNLNIDKEWEDFKMHFEQVHPSFFDKLKAYSADLTEENLRLCAYFRIGMSTKQIAQLLHIIPPSVIKNRHRLKRKLGLTDEDDLDDFIRGI